MFTRLLLNSLLAILRNTINKKIIPKDGNPEKIVNIVEKTLDFNEQEKGKGLKMLTPNQILQRLTIALPPVKAGNISETY